MEKETENQTALPVEEIIRIDKNKPNKHTMYYELQDQGKTNNRRKREREAKKEAVGYLYIMPNDRHKYSISQLVDAYN